jgi:hypothetical protein
MGNPMEILENKRGQKLYYYLSRLNEKELRDFHAYLSSPLLGNSPQFARMLLTIQERVLATNRSSIDADLFQEEFSPGGPLDEKVTKYIRIRLVQMLDKFMDFTAFMDYRADRNAQDIHLLKALHTRGWEKYFLKVHEEVEARPPIKKDGEYHLYRLWRAVVKGDFLAERRPIGEEKEAKSIVERLEIFLTHLTLKYASAEKNESMGGTASVVFHFIPATLEYFQQNKHKMHRETTGYYHAYRMFTPAPKGTNSTNEPFEHAKAVLVDDLTTDKSEKKDLFAFLINHCLREIRMGDSSFRMQRLQLYEFALKTGIISDGGRISKAIYKNIIVNMCQLGEIEWAEKFLEEWKDRIAGDRDHLGYYNNLAHILFHKKEYEKAIEVLYNRVTLYEDAPYGLSARTNICRALWHIKDYEWLLSNLEAMRQFIGRVEDLAGPEKIGYDNFIRYLSRMATAIQKVRETAHKKLLLIEAELVNKKLNERMKWLYTSLVAEIESISPKNGSGEG